MIRIIWYNTWCLPIITSESHIKHVARYLIQLVTANKVDLIGLAEVFGGNKDLLLDELKRISPVQFTVYSSTHGKQWWGCQSSGLMLIVYHWTSYPLYRIRCEDVNFHSFQKSHLWDCIAAKGFIVTPVIIENKETSQDVTLVFTHLQNSEVGFSVHKGRRTVIKQVHEIFERVKLLSHYAIIGDINIEPRYIPTSLLNRYKSSIVSPLFATTKDTMQLFDYVICSRTLRSRLRVNIIDDFENTNNPSDHFAIQIVLDTSSHDGNSNAHTCGDYYYCNVDTGWTRIDTHNALADSLTVERVVPDLNYSAYCRILWMTTHIIIMGSIVVSYIFCSRQNVRKRN